jgi:hypothetical protein
MPDIKENVYRGKKFDRILALLAVTIAGLSFWVAWQSTNSNERIVRVNTYMVLRQDFKEVISDIPGDFMDEDSSAPPQDSKDWKRIQDYWYHAFDEWYITTQLDPTLQALWDTRYKDIITSMLEKNAFRKVLCYLIKKKFPENDIMKEYGLVLQEIYKQEFHKTLCPE